MKMDKKKRFYKAAGQTTIEIAVLIAVIVVALVAMQVYLKRGIQGGLRARVDGIGEQYDHLAARGERVLSHTTNTTSTTRTEVGRQDAQDVLMTSERTQTHNEVTTQSGTETVAAP